MDSFKVTSSASYSINKWRHRIGHISIDQTLAGFIDVVLFVGLVHM